MRWRWTPCHHPCWLRRRIPGAPAHRFGLTWTAANSSPSWTARAAIRARGGRPPAGAGYRPAVGPAGRRACPSWSPGPSGGRGERLTRARAAGLVGEAAPGPGPDAAGQPATGAAGAGAIARAIAVLNPAGADPLAVALTIAHGRDAGDMRHRPGHQGVPSSGLGVPQGLTGLAGPAGTRPRSRPAALRFPAPVLLLAPVTGERDQPAHHVGRQSGRLGDVLQRRVLVTRRAPAGRHHDRLPSGQ